jgi:hypothetical protein
LDKVRISRGLVQCFHDAKMPSSLVNASPGLVS